MKKQTVLLTLMILAFAIILIAEAIHMRRGERLLPLAWTASVIVLISTVLWRFWAIDESRWADLIQNTNTVDTAPLSPRHYLNMMGLAMLVGLVATVTIYQNFFLGAGVYFVMQLCLIAAYNGILHLSPRKIWTSAHLRQPSLLIGLFWLIITPLVFVLFVYNGNRSLIVAPYVMALGVMALVVSLGLAYGERPFRFRSLATLGASLFFFSDAIIGHTVFVNPNTSWIYLISPTYVLAIILLSHASLAWPQLWVEAE